MKLNKEEMGMGAAFGLAFSPIIGLWCLLAALLCSILWAIGGSGKGRIYRYAGCPAAVFVAIWFTGHGNALIAMGICAMVLTIGYGIPDGRDKGSFLGKIFYSIFQGNSWSANLGTRAAYAILLAGGPSFFIPGALPILPAILIVLQLAAVIFLDGEVNI